MCLALAGCISGRHGAADAAATQSAAEDAAPAPPKVVKIVAVGDVMLDRAVGAAIRRNGHLSILAEVRDVLRQADVTFCNLECPLSRRGPRAPMDCVFRADPAAVKVLVDGGFDIVSVANNHTLNSGRRALMDTLDVLDAHGIRYCGARRQPENSWWPVYFDVSGVRVGFMAYTDLSFAHGSYCKVAADLSNLRRQVAVADGKCDLLVVSFHWGEEYRDMPTARQRKVARAAVEAGADLILGHHPHVLEGIAALHGAPILYSMGNFVFDQRPGVKMESAIFELVWQEGEGWHIVARPVVISRKRFGPEWPSKQKALKIAQRLVRLSRRLGSYPSIGPDGSVVLDVRARQPRVAQGEGDSG